MATENWRAGGRESGQLPDLELASPADDEQAHSASQKVDRRTNARYPMGVLSVARKRPTPTPWRPLASVARVFHFWRDRPAVKWYSVIVALLIQGVKPNSVNLSSYPR